MSRGRSGFSSSVAKMGVFAALYAVASLIPLSIFIGAPSFLSFNLMITPVIAIIMPPFNALVTALIGGAVALWMFPGQAMFGLGTLLLPTSGALFGSLLFHRSKCGAASCFAFLTAVILMYLLLRPSFPYWIAPHSIAIAVGASSIFFNSLRKKILATAFVSTMCEQAAMLIQAVSVLQLPAEVFMTAFPLMIYERAVATVGGFLLIEALAIRWKLIINRKFYKESIHGTLNYSR